MPKVVILRVNKVIPLRYGSLPELSLQMPLQAPCSFLPDIRPRTVYFSEAHPCNTNQNASVAATPSVQSQQLLPSY